MVAVPGQSLIDLSGQKFGRWIVISLASGLGRSRWYCRCDCGTERAVDGYYLRSGRSQSCGCLQSEIARNAATRHGAHNTGAYISWCAMLARCHNPANRHFADYGGRGIGVCARWRDFASFLADMGERPGGMSIDREDVNGNYEPSNCRWANAKTQRANRRDSRPE